MAASDKCVENVSMELGDLLDAGDGAVVTLIVGDTRLAVHRAVLSARSPVFAAMFRHDTVETSSGQVNITDVEGPVLRQLLSYLYTGRVPQLPSMAPQLLAAADKYGLSALRGVCEQQVAAQLSVETAAVAAVVAVRHCCVGLKQAAISFIKDNIFHVVGTQGWADAVHTYPETVVEVSQLLAEPPAGTSAAATTESRQTAAFGTQPHTDLNRAGVTAAQSMAARRTPPPDDTAISSIRNLPAAEKFRRLMQAAKNGAVDELRTLLAAGADVRARYSKRWTALHYAAASGHLEAVRCLLDSGADVGARIGGKNTALHMAASYGHTSVVRILAAASSGYINDSAEYGKTPLHWAAQNDRTEAAAALLEAGADRGAWDEEGRTPLDYANSRNNHQLIRMLQ